MSNEEVEGENGIVNVENKDDRWSMPIMDGYIFKFGKKSKSKISWDYRYFILNKDGTLWYFANNKKNQKPKKNRPVIVKGMRFWRCYVKRCCLEIERADKPFMCYFKDSNEMRKWISKLKLAGGIFCEKRIRSSLLPDYATKNVVQWKTEDILDWLDFFDIPNYGREVTLCDLYGFKFQAKKLTGKKLLAIEKDEELLEIGIENGEHRTILFHVLGYLKKYGGKFDVEFHTVLKKMLRMIDGRRGRLIIPEQHQICEKLCRPVEMIKSYLWTGLDSNVEYKSLEEVIESISVIIIDIDPSFNPSDMRGDSLPDAEDPALFGEPQQLTESSFKFDQQNTFSIKLVFSEIPRISRFGSTQRLLSPLISEIPALHRDRFSKFMSGLIIGPYYFEWNDSSLCIPRRISNHWDLISKSIDEIGTMENISTSQLIQALSEFVCEWNQKRDYDEMPNSDKSVSGNCQDFVDALLNLDFIQKNAKFNCESFRTLVQPNQKTAFSNSLEEMRRNGSCKLELRTTDVFRKQYRLENKKPDNICFDNHRELDEFYRWLEETGETEFSLNQFPDEVRMLKTFDRAFWYRHFKFPRDLGFIEMTVDEKKCPFGDPRKN